LSSLLAQSLFALFTHGNITTWEVGMVGLAAWALSHAWGARAGTLLGLGAAVKGAPIALAIAGLGSDRRTALRGAGALALVGLAVVGVELLWGPALPFRGWLDGATRGHLPTTPNLTAVLARAGLPA